MQVLVLYSHCYFGLAAFLVANLIEAKSHTMVNKGYSFMTNKSFYHIAIADTIAAAVTYNAIANTVRTDDI